MKPFCKTDLSEKKKLRGKLSENISKVCIQNCWRFIDVTEEIKSVFFSLFIKWFLFKQSVSNLNVLLCLCQINQKKKKRGKKNEEVIWKTVWYSETDNTAFRA